MAEEQSTAIVEQDPDMVDVLGALNEEFALIDQQDAVAFQNWYMAQLNSINACRAELKVQIEVMKRELDTRQRALEYRWYDDFKQAVEADLDKPGYGKKSVNYLQGRAGFRKGKDKLVVTDEAAAVSWALDNDCAGAVDMKLARTTLLMESYQATKKKPAGCDIIPAKESFFPKMEKYQLPAEPEKARLPEQEETNG